MNFPSVGGGSKDGSGGLFLKLGDGDKVTGVLRGDPKLFRVHWDGSRYQACLGGESCKMCVAGDEAKTRAKFNLISKVDGVWMARIWDVSMRTFIELRELQDAGYSLEDTALSITCKGVKKDKRITVLPLKNNGGLTPKDFKVLGAVPLNPLGGSDRAPAAADNTLNTQSDADEEMTEEDIPF